MILALLIASFLAAAIPCGLFCFNLRLYAPPPSPAEDLPAVSILIPARNEAEGIADAITSALTTRGIPFELVIMDDSSTDATPDIVRSFSAKDPRVRLEQAPALPAGWNGKQHACWALGNAARNPLLCFVDADVRLHPDCLARMATLLTRPHVSESERNRVPQVSESERNRVPQVSLLRPGPHVQQQTTAPPASSNPALVSGFPRQLTGSPLEWLLIPLIHFVLLGFLPLKRMRASTNPGFAAGCGQFMMCTREAYFACGGHSGIPLTMHDGLRLPKLFREHGYHTDLADLTPLASVRMYTNTRDAWLGLAKNATEGIAAPARIVPISIILLLGQVLPFALLLLAWSKVPAWSHVDGDSPFLLAFAALLCCLPLLLPAWLPRILAARRFRQDWRSALLHPLGILLLLAVQWYALIRKLRGAQVSWRGRAYTKPSA
jgi:glycosyltransferase involved in cell wall biosynthesis